MTTGTQKPAAGPATNAPKRNPKRDMLAETQYRNKYYKDGLPLLLKACLAAGVILVGSIAVATYSIQKKSQNRYIATYPDGSILNLIPLNQPNQSNTVVKNWLSQALAETFEVDYVNYKQQLNRSINTYFTNSGGNELVKSLGDSGFLDMLTTNMFVSSLTSLSDPVLVKHGNFGAQNYYAWLFQMNGSLTLQNQQSRYVIPVKMTITVSRRNTLEYPLGLGVARIFIEMEERP